MQFGAIIIGDEIMSGKRQDKHMAQAIATLGERGSSWRGANTSPMSRR